MFRITQAAFRNIRCLRSSVLPLSQFTLLVGPNGSGKTTALRALRNGNAAFDDTQWLPADVHPEAPSREAGFTLALTDDDGEEAVYENIWQTEHHEAKYRRNVYPPNHAHAVQKLIAGMRMYWLDADAIRQPVELAPDIRLGEKGQNLAGVLDRLRDQHPERFKEVSKQFGAWLPEYDQVLFDTPAKGTRSLRLRFRQGGQHVPLNDVSDGGVLSLALLALAYLPDPPTIVAVEEPDRGIHPRLLREVRDALYRLAYPSDYGEQREPVQVIATTHSPYMLDLFRETPEEVVVAQKRDGDVRFERLSDRSDLDDILRDTPLGEAWYSGILGGVPAES